MENIKYKILIVDDEPLIRKSLYEILRIAGYDAAMAISGEEAAALLKTKTFDIVITDLKLPRMSGIELLNHIKKIAPETEVILITGYGSIETAVEAIKKNAFDYVTKPILDDEIKMVIKKIIEKKQILLENTQLKKIIAQNNPASFCNLIGTSKSMQSVYRIIESVANTNATIMITGESGTGKGMVARAIHQSDQSRHKMPFVEVSCGTLSETLLESELFGHAKGAFTGAIKDKIGRFEAAHGGTIFLDEIDTCSPGLQVKLLRILQDGGFERVGDTDTKKTDARIIVATNQDLEKLIAEGKFREDLYYRIHVIPIVMPSLRERPEDIELLANHFIHIFNNKNKKHVTGLSEEVKSLFMEYPWPGNVRQLENAIEGSVIMAKGQTIALDDLPKNFFKKAAVHHAASEPVIANKAKTLKESLADPTKDLILKTLKECAGNRSKAAEMLGVNRTTLYNKMKKYDIPLD